MTKDWTQVGKERFNLHPSRLDLTKEFNLSDKLNCNILRTENFHVFIYKEDVKEFIRLLKGRIGELNSVYDIRDVIDKLVGDDLK